jgi:hypothetical protein
MTMMNDEQNQAIAELAKREAKRKYQREWRKNNPDKVKAHNDRYWEKKGIKIICGINPEESKIPEDSSVTDGEPTEMCKFLHKLIHTSVKPGSQLRRIHGKAFDLSTEHGRFGYAETVAPLLLYLESKEQEMLITELTVLTGVSIRSILRRIDSEKTSDKHELSGDIVRCRDCIKWHTVACPMANSVEQLIMLSNMFDDDQLMNYALNRYCSEGEREVNDNA